MDMSLNRKPIHKQCYLYILTVNIDSKMCHLVHVLIIIFRKNEHRICLRVFV